VSLCVSLFLSVSVSESVSVSVSVSVFLGGTLPPPGRAALALRNHPQCRWRGFGEEVGGDLERVGRGWERGWGSGCGRGLERGVDLQWREGMAFDRSTI